MVCEIQERENGWVSIAGIPTQINSIPKEEGMSFRLIYEGQLLSSNGADHLAIRRNKHGIRKQIHSQLKRLWQTDRRLNLTSQSPIPGKPYYGDRPFPPDEGLNYLAKKYGRGGYGFIPLVGMSIGDREPEVVCSLNILFLRREPPGALVQGGDIDNRINTLFDGLKIPDDGSGVTEEPNEDEKPMYCLLKDDRLISEVKVTTDRLLKPQRTTCKDELSDVLLVIEVDIKNIHSSFDIS